MPIKNPPQGTGGSGQKITSSTLINPIIEGTISLAQGGGQTTQVVVANGGVGNLLFNVDALYNVNGSATFGTFVFQNNTMLINNPAATFAYTLVSSPITSAVNITLPTLTVSDTFVFANFIQTLTNKTLDNTNNFSGTATTATAGSQTLPANPAGFVTINVGGAAKKLPYYNT